MSLIYINPYAFPAAPSLPAIGAAYEGGFFAGTISHTEDGVATHALIVAPRATGASGTGYTLTTSYAWKTTATSTTGTGSSFDGYANTAAMEAAGLANHPAANFCRGLTINGFSDWYYPSHYELDIAYENLKPSTANNLTSFGINPYSVPERTANRTAGAPAQTSVADFQAGGTEAFVAGNHGTSTQNDATSAYWMSLNNGFTGTGDFGVTKIDPFFIRAFRRVTL